MITLPLRLSEVNSCSCKVLFDCIGGKGPGLTISISIYVVSTPVTALSTVDVKVFRHEFINIFRFSDERTLHPVDINIIEPINDELIRYEEENETVFLARDIMQHMRKLTDPRRNTVGMGRTFVKNNTKTHLDATAIKWQRSC